LPYARWGLVEVQAKAMEPIEDAEARHAVDLFAARRDIEPCAALLELVQWTAEEVDYCRQQVRALDEDDLTWGRGSEKGGDDRGTTADTKLNIAYVMRHRCV
jgi:hypothetical protein